MESPIRVLHVDDEPDLAAMVGETLERLDDRFTVHPGTSAAEGLTLLDAEPIDCVVSDYEMPGRNGIEFLEAVRETRDELPFILFTGKGSEEIASEAISAGVTDYLQKGAGTGQYELLANRIANVVEQARATRAAAEAERRMREVAEETDDVLWLFDADWSACRFVNSAYEDIWGMSPSRLRSDPTSFLEAVHPDDRDRAERAMDRLADGASIDFELRVNPNEGYCRWVWIRADPVRAPDGTIDRLVGCGRDVTERKERERERAELRERMAHALRETESVVFELNLATGEVIHRVNFESMLAVGSAQTESIEAFAERVVHPDDRDRFLSTYERLLDGETEGIGIEYRTRADVSAVGWLRDDVSVVTASEAPGPTAGDGGADPEDEGRAIGVARNITDRRERERELERIRDFFTGAERLGDLGAWEFDGSGRAIWTDGTYRIHGVDRSFEPTVDDGIEFFHHEDRDRVRAAVEAALERGDGYDVEARLVTPDGTVKWVRASGEPVADDPGTVRGFIQDVTDRRARERRLREARGQLEAAVAAGAVGTWEWHVTENRLEVGQQFAETFDVDPAEARAGVPLERFTDSIHPEDQPDVEEAIETALAECGAYSAEYRVKDADGEWRWVVARGHVECDADGTPVRFPGTLTDITDQKDRERRLERQNERLESIANVVSHDLRNPLRVAEGRLDMLRDSVDSEHLDAMATAIDRMDALIEDLLTWTAEGVGTVRTEPVSVAPLVDSSWGTVETGDATIDVDIDDRRIRADPDRLRHLLENLLANAVIHGGDGVRVTVEAMADGFAVADDGPGIPPDRREEVFEPGHTTAAAGTGFGLGIVRAIAEAHGWSVSVAESATGGARIEITGVTVVPEDDDVPARDSRDEPTDDDDEAGGKGETKGGGSD